MLMHEHIVKGWIRLTHTSGSCFLDSLVAGVGWLGSTSGIPNLAARALRFSSSGSSVVEPTSFVVEVVDAGSCGGAGS